MLESGMNTVEVTVYAHQGRWNDNNLWYPDRMHGLIQEIRLAKAAGMKVVLILRLQMDHAFSENKFLWHGMIRPESEYFLWRWFEQYYDFANKWSRIAEEEKVDMVVLGSEMNALFSTTIVDEVPGLEEYFLNDAKQKRYHDKVLAAGKNRLKEEHLFVYNAPNYTDLSQYLVDQSAAKKKWAETVAFSDSTDQMHAINVRRTIQNDYWERLIRGIRHDYKGKLTVAANFDNYQEIKFWDKLDCIGINAYFPLRHFEEEPTPELFQESWSGVLDEIEAFKAQNGLDTMPVIFTELGYSQYSGSTLSPWQGDGFILLEHALKDSLVIWREQPQDLNERNMALEALRNAVNEKEFPLAGILYWKFTSHEYHLDDDPFSVLIGKASQDSLLPILRTFREE